jgi:hypothetical protein
MMLAESGSGPRRPGRIIADRVAQYPEAPAFKAGEAVICGKTDPEAPGWTWCASGDGRSAWVPVRIVQRGENSSDGRILEDYDARELTAKAGETLNILTVESGWALVENTSGRRGWIPEADIELIEE